MILVIIALKGHSFIFTNYGLEKQSTERIPNSFGHYCYFMWILSQALIYRVCPTLLYELDYPRTTTIRLGYIVKTSLYMIGAFILMYVIMMQVIITLFFFPSSYIPFSLILIPLWYSESSVVRCQRRNCTFYSLEDLSSGCFFSSPFSIVC